MRNTRYRFFAAIVFLLSLSIASLGQSKAFDTTRMDRSVAPCNDFFQFVNGNWLKSTDIPPSESRWGTFNILGERNNLILKEVLETAAKKSSKSGSDTQLIGDFYSTCMDEAAIEKAGTEPLKPYFTEIDGISKIGHLAAAIARLHDMGVPAVFGFGVGPDLKNSNAVMIGVSQGGISLPNRDYYTKEDEKSVETRQKFTEHVSNMFKLLGESPDRSAANAAAVMRVQKRLATAALTPVELRDPDNRYNKISFDQARALTPDFDLDAYMRVRGLAPSGDLNVAPPKFFTEVNAMLKDVTLEDWKIYLKWMSVNAAASYLPKAFADENFEFFGKYLSGQKERQPRWRICVQNTNSNLGEALGMEYARRTFKPAAKARMNELIDNLMASMKDRIDGLEWMSPETKKQAQYKLSTFKRKIGYPDKLRGYKGLSINKKSYAGNILRSNKFQIKRNFEDLGKPRDKDRWGFTPSIVNASYSSVNNDITFPAGILQPPFFNFEADDAVNYGAIGGVIGHEITHGFDDQGSRFDAEGNLKMWWTSEDRTKFEDRAACVVKQWDEYEVQPGLFMVGKLALGENIGDFAGLTVAYDAYMRSLKGKPRPADIDGFTAEQRFFLGWGQVWAAKYTSAAEIAQVKNGPHSLPKWRVNGPLSNMPQFREAFACKTGTPMVREKSCSIW
jgi:Predicted metalloendopeptidase